MTQVLRIKLVTGSNIGTCCMMTAEYRPIRRRDRQFPQMLETTSKDPGSGRIGEPNGYAMHTFFWDTSSAYDITLQHTSFFIIVSSEKSSCLSLGKFPENAPLTLSEYFSDAQWKSVTNGIHRSNQRFIFVFLSLLFLEVLFLILIIPLGALSLIPAALFLLLLCLIFPFVKWQRSRMVMEFNLKFFNNGFYWWAHRNKQFIGFWTPLLARSTSNPHDVAEPLLIEPEDAKRMPEIGKGYNVELVHKDAKENVAQQKLSRHKRRRSSQTGGGSVLDADALGDNEDMGHGGEWIDPNTPSNTPPGRVTIISETPAADEPSDLSGGATLTDDGSSHAVTAKSEDGTQSETGISENVQGTSHDSESDGTVRMSVVVTPTHGSVDNKPLLDFASAKNQYKERERPIDPESVPHAYRQRDEKAEPHYDEDLVVPHGSQNAKLQEKEEEITSLRSLKRASKSVEMFENLSVVTANGDREERDGSRSPRRAGSRSPRIDTLANAFEQTSDALPRSNTLEVRQASGRRKIRRSRSRSPRLEEISSAFEQHDTPVSPLGWANADVNKTT